MATVTSDIEDCLCGVVWCGGISVDNDQKKKVSKKNRRKIPRCRSSWWGWIRVGTPSLKMQKMLEILHLTMHCWMVICFPRSLLFPFLSFQWYQCDDEVKKGKLAVRQRLSKRVIVESSNGSRSDSHRQKRTSDLAGVILLHGLGQHQLPHPLDTLLGAVDSEVVGLGLVKDLLGVGLLVVRDEGEGE